MADNYSASDAPIAWREAPVESVALSSDALRKALKRVDSDVRNHAIQMYVGALFNVISCVILLVISETVAQAIGATLACLGWGFAIVQVAVYRRKAIAEIAGTTDKPSVDFYRAVLERQRDFHRGAAVWARFVALALGPAVFFVSTGWQERGGAALFAYSVAAVFVGLFALGIPVARRKADAFQKQIDALQLLQRGS